MAISPVDVLVDVATGLIVVVLFWAGVSKLRSSLRTLEAMRGLGIPRVLQRRWVARLVPAVEVTLALVLLSAPGVGRLVGAVAALVMFSVFTFYIARAVAQGKEVSCECFGQASRDPIDRLTVTRNLLLVVISAVATGSGIDGMSLFRSLESTRLLAIALLILIAALVSALVSQHRHMNRLRTVINGHADRYKRASDDPLTGSPIPDVEVVGITGVTRTLSQLAHRRAVLLIFVKAGCGDCSNVLQPFPKWRAQLHNTVKPVFISSSAPETLFAEHPEIDGHTYFGASAAREALGVRTLPTAILLASGGAAVATEVVEGSRAIAELVDALESTLLANEQTRPRDT